MGSNYANTTISTPGPGWGFIWGNGPGFKNFQLDIVGFLAVLGESSVTANAQVSALSRLFYLPRLLPAPQALLPPSRATTLPSTKAWVTSVDTGNYKEHIHHVANILLGEELTTFEVRCVEVTKNNVRTKPSWTDILFRGVQRQGSQTKKRDRRLVTALREGWRYFVGNGKDDDENDDPKHPRAQTEMQPEFVTPPVKAKATGPLTWVTLTGFFLSISLFIISIVLGDGYSMLATLLLSFLSTLIGVANKWNLKLAKRAFPGRGPDPGDTVIRYPNGSFLVVKCNDDVARELYFAPEEIEYELESAVRYRLISLIGTLILMLGIIFLANAKLQLQFAWAGAYGIINAAHWAAAAVEPSAHWDLSCYIVKEQSVEGGPYFDNFTASLWNAILVSKGTRWVRNGAAAPQTSTWDAWLEVAERKAKTAGFIHGPLTKPKATWSDAENAKNGIIWQQPKDWDPKAVYNQIDDVKKAEKAERDAEAGASAQ